MAKRKSTSAQETADPPRRRSLRHSINTAAETEIQQVEQKPATNTQPKASSTRGKRKSAVITTEEENDVNDEVEDKKPEPPRRRGGRRSTAAEEAVEEQQQQQQPEPVNSEEAESTEEPPAKRSRRQSTRSSIKSEEFKVEGKAPVKPKALKGRGGNKTSSAAAPPKSSSPTSTTSAAGKKTTSNVETTSGEEEEKTYWLLKAEPETRYENGVDVRFSIDDLAAKKEPEPWDGIRNYVARNNLRAMKRGDLAFFYHSNCKEPGIVGVMEIVREHTPDLSAHDPKAPYYDAKSKKDDPKWSVVHVEFRRKFAAPIGLKELREMGDSPSKPLANMQLLKQSRLSVSKVSAAEWEYLMGVVEEREGKKKKK